MENGACLAAFGSYAKHLGDGTRKHTFQASVKILYSWLTTRYPFTRSHMEGEFFFSLMPWGQSNTSFDHWRQRWKVMGTFSLKVIILMMSLLKMEWEREVCVTFIFYGKRMRGRFGRDQVPASLVFGMGGEDKVRHQEPFAESNRKGCLACRLWFMCKTLGLCHIDRPSSDLPQF